MRPELRIVTLSHQEVASDALSVRGYAAWLPNSYTLVPSYSNIEALMAFDSALGGSSSSALLGAGGVDQVAGAGEFMYFIVSPQVGRPSDHLAAAGPQDQSGAAQTEFPAHVCTWFQPPVGYCQACHGLVRILC